MGRLTRNPIEAADPPRSLALPRDEDLERCPAGNVSRGDQRRSSAWSLASSGSDRHEKRRSLGIEMEDVDLEQAGSPCAAP